MRSSSVKVTGAVLLILGTAIASGGGYFSPSEECETGASLYIQPAEDSPQQLDETPTQFSNLSHHEKRVFLEAFTDFNGRTGGSRVYQEWNQSWFRNAPLLISYEGNEFYAQIAHQDCDTFLFSLLTSGGQLLIYIGALVLGIGALYSRKVE